MAYNNLMNGNTAKKRDHLLKDVRETGNRTILSDLHISTKHLEGAADLRSEGNIRTLSREVSERTGKEQELRKERKELEEKVEQVSRELKLKSQRLEEMNAALKVLLEMRNRDRKELEQSVLFNVMHFADPYLEKLKNSGLNETQKGYLDILESGLHELVSPFSRDLAASETNLTPTEARITNLIRFGKSSKEIAEVLNLSIKTIETHRQKIRTKLGLNKNKTNLQSYLQSCTASQKGRPLGTRQMML
jgi:DNA-binding CsgD family transcriptional regulator